MRIRSLATCLVLVPGVLLVPGAAEASGQVAVAGCGAMLTTDAYLTADLSCPGPNGVLIGADITLDLRGHQISGPGSGTVDTVGVGILDGFSIKLLNGTVQKWNAGTEFVETGDGPASGSAEVSNVSFTSNHHGASLGYYARSSFTNSRFVNNTFGISGSLYGQATVSSSIFRGNSWGAYSDDSGITMTGSVVDRNTTGIYCYDALCHLDRNVISNNGTGVSNGFIGSFAMTKNAISGNAIGVASGGVSFGDLRDNAFVRNKTGLSLESGFGTVYRNSFTGNDIGLSSSNYADGDFAATVEQNVALLNGDGFLITGVGDRLKSNTANWNRRWGINAPNAVDLGANKARGNGNNPQCVGVTCT